MTGEAERHFFLVAAGAQNILDSSSRSKGQNFLCHTSQKTNEHARAAMLIRNFLNRLGDDLDAAGSGTEPTKSQPDTQ